MHNTIKNIFVLIARPYDTPVSDAPLRDKTLVRHVKYTYIKAKHISNASKMVYTRSTQGRSYF